MGVSESSIARFESFYQVWVLIIYLFTTTSYQIYLILVLCLFDTINLINFSYYSEQSGGN